MLRERRLVKLSIGVKPFPVSTNPKELPVKERKARFWQKKAVKLNWSGLATPKCPLKKISQRIERVFAPVINATRQKINFQPDIGPVKHGDCEMKVVEVLSQLEKHEAECNLRYKRIEERMEDHKSALKTLDVKLWALAILILIAPLVQKLWA
tara:strand:+ start:625 stop:1083 length:459 start_codon:yes stop_codon:yes gene_type:complete